MRLETASERNEVKIMALKKLNQFNYFDAEGFFSKLKLITVGSTVWKEYGSKDMLLWKDEYLSDKDFEFVLGESYFGSESINISGTPHILIGGASGSGKSKLLKSILMQAKKKEAIVILADMKGGVDYPTIWHKKCTIITDPNNLKEIF